MIDHLSLGVRDIARAQHFYDATLAPLGYRCLSSDAGSLGYGTESVRLWILKVDRPVPADPQSGLHVCFTAPTRASVDAFHVAALRHGGADNGAPGLRADYAPDYYAAFVTDPDGYRLEAYCKTET
jgi:catechol 2,3-dioxygenase-like lactoylglutathione lyase family enzyme